MLFLLQKIIVIITILSKSCWTIKKDKFKIQFLSFNVNGMYFPHRIETTLKQNVNEPQRRTMCQKIQSGHGCVECILSKPRNDSEFDVIVKLTCCDIRVFTIGKSETSVRSDRNKM